MVNFASTKTADSVMYDGVSFTFRVMTEGVRNRINLKVAPQLEKIRGLQSELAVMQLPEDETTMAPATRARVLTIIDQIERVREVFVETEYFLACFVSTNATFDGTAISDPAKLLELIPRAFFREIVDAIMADAGLSVERRENLGSPTTLAAQVDGKIQDTTAATASEKDSTKDETAVATSPVT